jgi:hypothetical protein
MMYDLEYLNEDADIEILRFNTETKSYEIVKSSGYGGAGYIEPGREWIYVCQELSLDDSEAGTIKSWSQKIGEFRPEMGDESGEFERTDACVFIRTIVETDTVANFMEDLIKNIEKNRDGKKDFIQEYKT